MPFSTLHDLVTRAEEAILSRTLLGRRLERDVLAEDGSVRFARGREIDRDLLDEAREAELLEALAHAAEPGTSDTELEDLLWWRRQRADEAHDAGREEP